MPAVVGVGYSGFNANTSDSSWKEIMFEAAVRAYEDVGINPKKDVDSFVTCAEDFYEGFAIFDDFVPDQLGAVLKPTCTVCADFLYGLATADRKWKWLEIRMRPFCSLLYEQRCGKRYKGVC